MMPPTDPRDIVTPYAFRVEPRLLGTPIARPFRRGVAMLVDLLVLSVLLLVREMSGALLGIVIAWVLLRISGRGEEGKVEGPVARPLLRISAFVILFVSLLMMVQSCFGFFQRRTTSGPVERPARQAMGDLRLGEAVGLMAALGRVAAAGDSATAQPMADRVALLLARSGVDRPEREETLRELLRADEAPWRAAVARLAVERSAELMERERRPEAADREEVVAPWPESGEPPPEGGAVDTLAPDAPDAPEAPEARETAEPPETVEDWAAVARSVSERQRTRRAPGIVAFFRGVAEDLGLGIGWAGVYFTIFTVLMGGRTPGKRLLGIRVVRLNGQPLGWWAAFSRFGGYAAGLATGLIGFLQLFWDANRQGIHDKIAGTVVVRDVPREEGGVPGARRPSGSPAAPGSHTRVGAR